MVATGEELMFTNITVEKRKINAASVFHWCDCKTYLHFVSLVWTDC